MSSSTRPQQAGWSLAAQAAKDGSLRLTGKAIDGKEIEVLVDPEDPVAVVVRKVGAKFGKSDDQIRIIVAGKQLENGLAIQAAGWNGNNTFHIVGRGGRGVENEDWVGPSAGAGAAGAGAGAGSAAGTSGDSAKAEAKSDGKSA